MPSLRDRVHDVVFEHERPAERGFDLLLIGAILLSVLVVMLDSVASVRDRYGSILHAAEWAFTILFTVEYFVRVWSARRPLGYVTSFYGVIDLLAVLPAYLGLVFPAGRFIGVIRVLRVLRVFRILKLGEYVREASVLAGALRASQRKVVVFVYTILTIVVVVGSLMYLIEGPESGFTSIPESVYWAIVTLTTVGYGDISPQTAVGKSMACALMVVGYGVIAVPTGIVTVELQRATRLAGAARACPGCGAPGHDADATYCKHCGHRL